MMVIQGVNGQHLGRSHGFGAGLVPLVNTVDYACGKTICWAKGKPNEAILMALQSALNRFAAKLGFAPIQVDGFIGDASVAAASKVLGATFTREKLTQNAPMITLQLIEKASSVSLPAVAPPPPVAKPPAVAQEEAAAREAAAAREGAGAGPAPADTGSNWLWWTLGIVAVAGVGTVGYMTWKRRKEGRTPEPVMAGHRRYRR